MSGIRDNTRSLLANTAEQPGLRLADAVLVPSRHATLATVLLCVAIYIGSSRLTHFDPALSGYCAATLVACFALVYRASAFWRRGPSAWFARVLWHSLAQPTRLWFAAQRVGQDMLAQHFIARRSPARWLAHMAVAWGTLASFAVTLPLVWGWLHFEAVGERHYRAVFLGLPLAHFDTRGAFAWLVFNTLNLCAVLVIAGAGWFLVQRLRQRGEAGSSGFFHLAPLLLLLAVAATGLGLTLSAGFGAPLAYRAFLVAHEGAVVLLLVSLPYGKLTHVFIRPLRIGAQIVQAASLSSAHCKSCRGSLAAGEQLDGVEGLLVRRGFRFDGHQRLCPPCRRRRLATTHARMLGGRFHPA